jgi:bifunctional oligoribonuclease and PAP phosphatase NrnA
MEKKLKQFKKLLEKAERILIISHKGPDLDAFSSMLATYKILKNQYPKKEVYIKVKQYPNINLPCMKDMKIVKSIDYEGEDLVIVTDIPELKLCVEEGIDTIQDATVPFVLIDHHIVDTDQKEWTLAINERRSSATEQVYLTFKEMFAKKFILDQDIASLVQYGIVADTNRFLYEITTPETHRVFAEVKEFYPVDIDIYTYKIKKFPQEATPVIVEYLKSLKIEDDMAYMYISRDTIKKNEFTKQGVNQAQAFLRDSYLRYIQGVHWGFIIRPSLSNEKMWDVAFRSTKGYQNVQIIAKDLGGGGHMFSAATRFSATSVEEVLQRVLDSVKKFVS